MGRNIRCFSFFYDIFLVFYMAEKKKKIGKTALICLLCAIVSLIVYFIWQAYGDHIVEIFRLLERGDQEEITEYLRATSRTQGFLLLYVFSILQVVSVVFPCMVIQVAGALIFGWGKSFLLCWLGFVSGNILVFIVARKLGKHISIVLSKNENPKENWLLQKINNGNPIFVVMLACMVPGVPNGIIPYIASQTKIRCKSYALAVAASSWIQILLNCIAGDFLAQGEYLFMILAFALEITIVIVVAKNRDKLLKTN